MKRRAGLSKEAQTRRGLTRMVVERMTTPIARLDIFADAELGWRPQVVAWNDELAVTAQNEADRIAQELRAHHFLIPDSSGTMRR